MAYANMKFPLSHRQGSHYDKATGIYKNTWPAPVIPDVSLHGFCFDKISFDDETLAFVDHGMRPRKITYGQLKLEVHRLGQGLIDAGFKQGEVIMVLAPNSIDWVILVLAAQFAGLTTALASPAYSAKELKHVYRLANPTKVFMPLRLTARAQQASFKRNTVIAMDNSVGTGVPCMEKLKVSPGVAKSSRARGPVSCHDTAMLAFSSGTTGLPKAVMLSHRNFVAMVTIVTCYPSTAAGTKRHLSILPFFHAMGLVGHVLVPIATHGQVHIQAPFNAQTFLQLIVQQKIQSTTLVPPIMLAFSRLPHVNRETFTSVEVINCGGAPLDGETQSRMVEKTGAEVSQGWGMTEATLGGLGCHFDMTPGTCGRVLPGVEAKLVDPDTGKSVAPGQRGELWVRGPNIFKGYLNNPQATQDTMSPDGFLKSGDIAVVSEQGEFSIVDRIKELIKYKGNQIAPSELEALINSHPKVALSGVIGVYAKHEGTEWPRAYVQLKEGESKQGMEKEIEEYVKRHASHVKWLRGGVVVLPQVPAGPSGKLLRRELRILAKREMDALQSDQPQARL